MGRKPTPLARVAMANSAIPPVTGIGGNNAPVANDFDDSGFWRGRSRSVAKRARTESEAERDALYDLSRDYVSSTTPPKPSLDPLYIRSLMVAATALSGTITPLLELPTTPPEMKLVINVLMLMMGVMEAVVEKGIDPLSAIAAGVGSVSSNRGFAKALARNTAPPPLLPPQNHPPLAKGN